MKNILGTAFILLITLGFIVAALAFIAHDAYQLLYYEPVPATVTEYIAPDPWADQSLRPGKIAYRYRRGDAAYEGFYPNFSVGMPRHESAVLAKRHHPGDPLTVFIHPRDPTQSTPEPMLQPFAFGMLTFIVPIFAVVAGGVASPRHFRLRKVGDAQMSAPPGMIVWLLISAFLTFIYMFNTRRVSWQAAAIIGACLPTIIAPGLSWLTIRCTVGMLPERSRPVGFTALIISFIAVVFLGAGVLLTTATSRALINNYRAQSWPTSDATIIDSRVVATSGKSTSYRAGVRYRYTVAGVSYTNDRYCFGSGDTGHDDSHRVVAENPVGARVNVRYNPENPADSVIRLGFQWIDGLGVLFSLLFVGCGCLLAWASVNKWKEALRQPLPTPKSGNKKKKSRKPAPGIP